MAEFEDIAALLRPSALRAARRPASQQDWTAHIPFAFWLMDVHRPGILVEIGTYSGSSYRAFAQAVQDQRLACQCFAIGTWQEAPSAGYGPDQAFADIADYNTRNFRGFSRLIRSNPRDAIQYFAERSIELLHIDGRAERRFGRRFRDVASEAVAAASSCFTASTGGTPMCHRCGPSSAPTIRISSSPTVTVSASSAWATISAASCVGSSRSGKVPIMRPLASFAAISN